MVISLTNNQDAKYSLAVTEVVTKLIESYDNNKTTNLSTLKSLAAKKQKIKGVPKVTDIIAAIPESYREKLLPFLMAKPVRSASGVAVVAVMAKPHRCPHIAMTGNVCVYCKFLFGDVC